MFAWLKELNEIRYERKKRELELKETNLRLEPEPENVVYCESCETLKQQLSIANREKELLLNRLLEKPEKEDIPVSTDNKIIRPLGSQRWNQQRAELEANDRRAAAALKEKQKEMQAISPEEIKEFEAELDSVTQRTGESRQ